MSTIWQAAHGGYSATIAFDGTRFVTTTTTPHSTDVWSTGIKRNAWIDVQVLCDLARLDTRSDFWRARTAEVLARIAV